MRFLRRAGSGWFYQSHRHSLAARGIKTSFARTRPESGFFEKPMTELVKAEPVTRGKIDALRMEVGRAQKEQAEEMGEFYRQQAGLKQPMFLYGRAVEKKGEEAMIEGLATDPFNKRLSRLASGVLDSDDLNVLSKEKDPSRVANIKRSIFIGAMANARAGLPIDEDILEGKFIAWTKDQAAKLFPDRSIEDPAVVNLLKLSGPQRAQIKRTARQTRTGETLALPGRMAEAAYGAVKAAGIRGAVAGGGVLKRGLTEAMKKGETPQERYYRLVEERRTREALRELKEEEETGAFSFAKISGLDKLEVEKKRKKAEEGPSKEELENALYPAAIMAKQQVNAFWKSKGRLVDADMSAFKKGDKAFRRGDREALADAIMDLEKEDMKLKDRWHLLQKTRGIVLSDDNRDQAIARGDGMKGEILPNALFGGGGGASELADQTKKISVMEKNIVEKSNMLNARIGHLQAKMRRLESLKPMIEDYPEQEIKVFGSTGSKLFAAYDEFGGKLKHKNPVLEGLQNKTVGNVALKAKNPLFEK
jgi:hypothetical protein